MLKGPNLTNLNSKENSFHKKYLHKLLSNFAGLAYGVIFTSLVPRKLGPTYFGIYTYLNEWFNQGYSFLEFGSSQALSTKLSQNPHEWGLLRFYCRIAFSINLILFLIFFAIYISPLKTLIFQDHSFVWILLAFFYATSLWLNTILTRALDSIGETVKLERVRLINTFLKVVFLLSLFLFSQITLVNIFISQFVFTLSLNINNYRQLRLHFKNASSNEPFAIIWKRYWPVFYDYCHPIALYTVVSSLCALLDRWLLQHFFGSTQQGYFSFSFQISTICILFTGSMIPLFHRNVAKASHVNDRKAIFKNLTFISSVLFFISALIAIPLSLAAKDIVPLIGGHLYENALPAIQLMALYPIHQTLGQILGTCFYALGLTKNYRNIALTGTFLGLIISLLILNPSSPFAVFSGAFALSIKYIIVQSVVILCLLITLLKNLNRKLLPFILNQIFILSILLLSYFISSKVLEILDIQNPYFRLFLLGLFYVASTTLISLLAIKMGLDLFLGHSNKIMTYLSTKFRRN